MKNNNQTIAILMALFATIFFSSCQQSVNAPVKGTSIPLNVSNWPGHGASGDPDLVTLTGTGGTVTGGSFTVTGATYTDNPGTSLIPSGEGKTEIEVAINASGYPTSTANAVDWVSLTGGSDNNGGGPVTWTVNTDTLTSGSYGFRTHYIPSHGRVYKENMTDGEDVTVSLCTDVTVSGNVFGIHLPPAVATDGNGSWSNTGSEAWSGPSITDTWNDAAKWTANNNHSNLSINFNIDEWGYVHHTCPNDHYDNTAVAGGYTGNLYLSIDGGTTWRKALTNASPFYYSSNGGGPTAGHGNNGSGFGNIPSGTYTVKYAATSGGTVMGTFTVVVP